MSLGCEPKFSTPDILGTQDGQCIWVDVSNGRVTVSPSTVEETTKNNTRYTLSHKQNQALAFSKQLCDLYNNALTDGMVNRDDTNSVRNILKKFVEVSPDGETLTPAVKRIAALR